MVLRVVQVIGSLQIGGAENQVAQLLNGWNSAKLEKYLICFSSISTPIGSSIGPDVTRLQINLPGKGQIGCILKMARALKKIRPHVVQAHMFHTNLYTALASRMAGVPVFITTEHGENLWKKPVHHYIERYVVSPLATARVAVSEDIRDIRLRTGDAPSNKLVVIPPCVEIPSKARAYPENRTVRIGAVGRMVTAKDYPTLLHAFASVITAGVKAELIFLGDGPERTTLVNLAQELNISETVIFAGFQSNVTEWLEGFDLVVFSSIREGIPVAMLEAMAQGVPIVATRVGGIPEVIRRDVDGLLVESGQPDALAAAICQIIQDPDRLRSIGLRGRQRVAALYSRQSICHRYEELFKRLLNQTRTNGKQ